MAKMNTSSPSTVRKPAKRLGLVDEFIRAQQVISGLTTSMPMILMTQEVVEEFQAVAQTDPVMNSLKDDLQRSLRAVTFWVKEMWRLTLPPRFRLLIKMQAWPPFHLHIPGHDRPFPDIVLAM